MHQRPKNAPWTEEELAALVATYPRFTSRGARAAALATARSLYQRGIAPYQRTIGAVNRMASLHGLRPGRGGGREKVTPQRALDALRLIQAYKGLPLSYEDLREELAIERKRAQILLEPLVRSGAIERITGPNGQALLRDPVAWRASAP